MKIAFLTNVSSPYRTIFFNKLGKYYDLDVWYEYRKEPTEKRDKSWENDNAKYYKAIYTFKLNDLRKYDLIIVCGISTPKEMMAILYMKLKGIKYILEIDGGFPKKVNFFKKFIKYSLTKGAKYYLSTGDMSDKYLISNGADESKIIRYHFSSTLLKETLTKPFLYEEKNKVKDKLEIKKKFNVLFVGRFLECKGIDTLLKAVKFFPKDTGVYLIGGELEKNYKEYIAENNLTNIYTIKFLQKEKLKEYYKAVDLLIFPSRDDIWGLVVNEAVAMGLPVVCSKGTIAGLELIKNDWNGWIFNINNYKELAEYVNKFYNLDFEKRYKMMENCIQIAKKYTIDEMVKDHIEFIEKYEVQNSE